MGVNLLTIYIDTITPHMHLVKGIGTGTSAAEAAGVYLGANVGLIYREKITPAKVHMRCK